MNFQIGQCRLFIDVHRTKEFYKDLPRISENCDCEDCSHYETSITDMNIRLFRILKKMGVDLKRQPNINPDGICSTGETNAFTNSYMGYYHLYGNIGKTQHKQKNVDTNGNVTSVSYQDFESNSLARYSIKQVTTNELICEFYLECEKK